MRLIKQHLTETEKNINNLVARIGGYSSNYFKPHTSGNDTEQSKYIEAIVETAKELEKAVIKRDTLYFANNVEDVLESKIAKLESEKEQPK